MQRARPSRAPLVIRWAAVGIWMGWIFFLSSRSTLPRLMTRWGLAQSLAGHFIEYAVLALLLYWGMVGAKVGHAARYAFLVTVAYGITDELHQRFVPGRSMDPVDLVTDAVGAAAALFIASLIVGRRAARRDRQPLRDPPEPADSGTPPLSREAGSG